MATTPVKVWTKLLGTSAWGSDVAQALTTGLDGSIYVAGVTTGALDGQTNSGASDAFLTKFSTDGTKAWTKLLGTSGHDAANALTTGLDGSIYVSGYANGSLDGQTYGGVDDAFLTKFSTDGTKAWTKLLGTSGHDVAKALITGLDGSIYVSGYTNGALDGQANSGVDAFLSKYSADGTKAWTKLLGTSGSASATALTTGLDGSIYVAGVTTGALDGQINSGGEYDAFLTKFSTDGTKAWTKLLGTSGSDLAHALTTGLDGSIYVSGGTTGALDGQPYSGYLDAFLTKYSADGTKAWTKLLGTRENDFADALTTGLDGSIYVSGYASGSLDGQIYSGNSDAFLTKFSTDGTKVWTKLLGTSGHDQAHALTTGLDGSIYVSGYASGSLDGQTYSGGQSDAFLTKFQELADPSNSLPTYSLSSSSSYVNEGSTATFTLSTTNLAAGTAVAYTLSGVSASDITGGALGGTATVNSSGTATISIPIAADSTTEGAETLSVTAQGKSASMTINDTSNTSFFLWGSTAGDAITNSPVSQNIDGGPGIDTMVFTSNSAAVVISKSGLNIVVTNTATGEVDTLINFERLKFADTAIALDTGGVGGQAYRVYQAAFNRSPDLGGLGYWISGMDGGASLKSVAQGFVSSAEFKAVYGASPTNAQIITKFYENVLNRAPESGGFNYWLGILNSGQGTIADVLAAFSESPENQSGVISVIEKGMRYTPYIPPTYSLSASATAVDEGTVATFTLRTTNVEPGTPVGYTLSGISAADVFGGALNGNSVVDSSGLATISVVLLNDLLTEGPETLKVTAGGASASTVVNDTSIKLIGTIESNTGGDTGGDTGGIG
jgi:methionine salvage enolase-phosphatase E1